MYKLRLDNNAQRLVVPERLAPADFAALAKQLGVAPAKARKSGLVSAQKNKSRRIIETLWNGKETSNKARRGDWLVVNLVPDGAVLRDKEGHANLYVIRADKFPLLYERGKGANRYGTIFRAIGEVEALYFSGGFEIMAPWDEIQRADKGYILKNGEDIYGNHKDTFEATYEIIS